MTTMSVRRSRLSSIRRSSPESTLAVGLLGVLMMIARVRDALAQGDDAGHRRILVEPGVDVLRDEVAQRLRAIEIREPLRQVDRVVLLREPRHHREDGGADV